MDIFMSPYCEVAAKTGAINAKKPETATSRNFNLFIVK
jgi:hypothetical protein